MARTRMIKPEFWSDEKLSKISRDARLTFIGMWNLSDDYGVSKGHPAWLKNNIFPYDDIKLSDFQKWLKELEAICTIIPFTSSGEQYYFIKNFSKHQTINRPSQAKNPSPPNELHEPSWSPHGALMDETETETETETEKETETETEKTHVAKNGNDANTDKKESDFEVFWKAYPNKTEKKYTLKCWGKINSIRPPIEELLEAIRKQTEWREKANGEFRPEWKNPATWLNKGCWEDELKTGVQNNGNRQGTFSGKQPLAGKAKSDGQPYPVDVECNE